MAKERDLSGIRQILRPLEESGILVKRTDEEVCFLLSIVGHYYTASIYGNLFVALLPQRLFTFTL